jgi:hypothetical protein
LVVALLFVGKAFRQVEEKEPAAIIEIGGAEEWKLMAENRHNVDDFVTGFAFEARRKASIGAPFRRRCGFWSRDGIAAGEWEASWNGLAGSARDCGGLTGMPCRERETRGTRAGSPACARGEFYFGRERDHGGERGCRRAREG